MAKKSKMVAWRLLNFKFYREGFESAVHKTVKPSVQICS